MGAGAESVVRRFLQSVLPSRYSVGSGFIRDADGGRSHQMDVVINDELIFGSFPYDNGKNLYLAESVAAVIQVKSRIDPRGLNAALDNLASAMSLKKRTARGEMRIMSEFDKAAAQIIRCYVFAFDCRVKLQTLREAFKAYYVKNPTASEAQARSVSILNVGSIVNFPPGYDKGGVKIGGEVRRGVIGIESEGDSLFHFLVQLFHEMPQVVYRPPILVDYSIDTTYQMLTD